MEFVVTWEGTVTVYTPEGEDDITYPDAKVVMRVDAEGRFIEDPHNIYILTTEGHLDIIPIHPAQVRRVRYGQYYSTEQQSG